MKKLLKFWKIKTPKIQKDRQKMQFRCYDMYFERRVTNTFVNLKIQHQIHEGTCQLVLYFQLGGF